jgi:Cu/Ag efflux pump CusA
VKEKPNRIYERVRDAYTGRLEWCLNHPKSTLLVACLGLLPAAISTGVGSDTQKPFAIVVVAGLLSRLFLGFFVNPVLYEFLAREGDVLQV